MGYVLNNPLKYNDPSGEFFWVAIAIGAVIGAYIGGSKANGNWNPLQWDWSSGATWAGIGIGAVVGAVGGEILAAGITGGLAFGIFSVKLGVGLAIPGIGAFGIAKAGEKIQTEFTNSQGETYTQDIGTIPTFGGGSNGGNSNDPPDETDDAAVDADDVVEEVQNWILENKHQIGVTFGAALNAYAGYQEINAGFAMMAAPTGVTQVAGTYSLVDGAVRILSTPFIITGAWSNNGSLENAPANLLGGVGFLIDRGVEGHWHTGSRAQMSMELMGDFGASRRKLIQSVEQGFSDPNTFKNIKNAGTAFWQIIKPYKDAYGLKEK